MKKNLIIVVSLFCFLPLRLSHAAPLPVLPASSQEYPSILHPSDGVAVRLPSGLVRAVNYLSGSGAPAPLSPEQKPRLVAQTAPEELSGQQVIVVTRERARLVEGGIVGGAALLVVLLLFWITTLKRQIRERKHAEKLLRLTEERYRTLLDKAPDAIMVIDGDAACIVDVNHSATELFACGRDELIGQGPQRFYTEQQPDGLAVPESMRLATARVLNGEEVVLERSVRNAQGKELLCEVHLTRLPSSDRRLIRASFRDITARKMAEQLLRATEKRYRDIFENAPVGIFQTTREGRIINVNPMMAKLFGFDSSEQFKSDATDIGRQYFVDPEQRVSVIREVLAAESFIRREVEYRRRDGSTFSSNLYIRVVNETPEGESYLEGFVEDITERERVTRELRKLSQAVEQSPVSILITDTRGNIEFVNPRFTQLTGYQAEEVLGRNTSILKSGSNQPETYRDLWGTITAGGIWEGELHNKKKDGELFWEHVTISPIRNQGGQTTNYIAIKEDITDQRKMKELLFQSQKMEAVGQLAGGVAHDFNNILTVIAGYATILRLSAELPGPLQEKVDQILAASEKAAQVTRGLLAFGRKQVMDIKVVNLNDIVQQIQRFLVRIIGEDIQLRVIVNEPELPVKADVGQIGQVLMNLGTNARDAMPKGGLLVIETGVQEVEPHGERGAAPASGRYAVLSVSDSGTGMDEVTRSKIFEPFFTTKEVGKGTGLGMAIVHGIITQHNGYIHVYSEPGKGSSFKIYLPLVAGEGVPLREQPAGEAAVAGGHETLLVAEDDPALRSLLQEVLSTSGYLVLTASDGEEAVAVFGAYADSIDLVVMDMIMPRRSGWEAAREIARLKPQTRILFTSGYTKDFIKSRGELQEGVELITKPVQPQDLLRAVRRILDSRR
ncbi:PAS domain S-box protein [Geomonas sp. Red32]|uniref:hybrid sensor histidine kinase/response regulator n=1 Tax=Geomonas sp. Red32 TaxID=2912856 RepID=UPI00202CF8B7|nr:PAS domain S-box protein [Geomonas sp. Red32]MCM0081893.1 PAS domain S-box protein [Geomonas sp. Red32]